MSDSPTHDPAAPDPSAPTVEPYQSEAVDRVRKMMDAAPTQIGRYRILEKLGGGGMGEVYRAEQRVPVRREVAIKLIKLGMDTKLVIARFEAERQALAMMDHPHIAKVYDADADDTGRPYFVMEYVKGRPITEYADANHLTITERLALFEQVCNAIQHAHHKGIIHRDLKPSNVLVSTQDGKPHAKVIDFGIAKATSQRLTDLTLYTQHDQFIGTPQYMSPEQADGSLDIDTRTDVYSLGVLLYELLTGSTPFASSEMRAAAMEQIKKLIREVDPPKPSTRLNLSHQTLPSLAASRRTEPKKLGLLLRGELDWIVMKALEKDRARRYDTPTSLSDDVERYLNGLPVRAAPPSAVYRARKFIRKYRAPLSAGLALAVLLVLGLTGTAIGLIQSQRAIAREREATVRESNARLDAQLTAYEANISAAQTSMAGESWPEARAHLDACPEGLRGWEWHLLHAQSRSPEFGFPQSVTSAQMTPDARYLLLNNGRDADLMDLTTRRRLSTFRTKWVRQENSSSQTYAIPALASDGRVAVQMGKEIALHSPAGEKILSVPIQKEPEKIHGLQFSPGGGLLLVTHDNDQQVYNSRSGQWVCTFPARPWMTQFCQDETLVVSQNPNDYTWHLTSLATGQEIRSIKTTGQSSSPWACVLSPSGDLLATGTRDGAIALESTMDGKPVRTLLRTNARVTTLAFSPDGTLLFSEESSGEVLPLVRVFDVASGKQLAQRTFEDSGYALASDRLANDGRRLFWGGGAFIWDWARGDAPDAAYKPAQNFSLASVSADGRTVVTVDNARARVWRTDVPSRQPLPLFFARDDDTAAPLPCINFGGRDIAMADWGDVAAAAVRVHFERPSGASARQITSPDGAWSAEASGDRSIVITDTRTRRPIATLDRHEGRVIALAVTRDGKRLISGSDDCTVRFWNTDGWRQVFIHRRNRPVTDLGLTGDGQRLVVAFADKSIESWDARDAAAYLKDSQALAADAVRQTGYVQALFDGPIAWDELARTITVDGKLTADQKIAALQNLNDQLTAVRGQAQALAAKLKEQLILKANVEAAIAARRDLPRALVKALSQQMADWKQDPDELGTATWNAVRKPDQPPEVYAAALAAAAANVKEKPKEHSVYNTYLLALYRAGRYDETLEAVRRAAKIGSEANNQALPSVGMVINDEAVAAMALYRQGKTDEARARLRWPARSFGIAGDNELIAEAARLIDPATTQPITTPISQKLAGITDAIDAQDVEELKKHYGKKIKIKGRVTHVRPTQSRSSYTVLLEPIESAALVWVTGPAAKTMNDAFIDSLIHSEVVITGTINEYGGKSPAWQGRPQLSIEGAADFQIITPGDLQPIGKPVVATAATKPTGTIDAKNTTAVKAAMDTVVTLSGKVGRVSWNAERTTFTLFLEPEASGVLAWSPTGVTATFDKALLDQLRGAEVVVTGRLGTYGGKSKNLFDRPQITLGSRNDLQVTKPGFAPPPPVTQPAAQVLAAEDVAALGKHLGEVVTVTGIVADATGNSRGTVMNLSLQPANKGLLVFIPTTTYKRLGLTAADIPPGAKLTVTGKLGRYGGKDEGLKGRLQLLVDNHKLFQIGDPATQPTTAATTRPTGQDKP